MPVGHERINDPNVHPNPDVTFIRALEDKPNADKAREMLEALAAQFRPITKARGYGINSLEEHDWNPQFGGRNFNGGEIIEIVLRRPDGSFQPYQWLLYVMCHELAHIDQMNHSHAFQKINKDIRADLSRLRAKGYFGDGFWSQGRALTGGKSDIPMGDDEQPNYACGGAMKRSRKRKPRAEGAAPRRAPGSAKMGQTGRQTAIPRKAGGRVTKAGAFQGEGNVLNSAPEMSTFRRQANAKSAVEARAAAAELRMQQAKAASQPPPDRKAKFEEKGKGKATSIDLCSSSGDDQDDDELWENEDELIERDDSDARNWLNEDLKTWEDDCVIIDGSGETATTSGSSKNKPAASKSSASKRGRTESDSDGPPKKAVKPKSRDPGPAPNPTRTWRATSEERDEASKGTLAKLARSPQQFFSSGTTAEANHAALNKKRQKSYVRSTGSPAKKTSKRLLEPSDSDSDTITPVGPVKPATVKRPKKVKVAVKAAGSTQLPMRAIVADVDSDNDEELFALPWNYLDATPAERRRFLRDLDREIERDEKLAEKRKGVMNSTRPKESGSVDRQDASGSGLAK